MQRKSKYFILACSLCAVLVILVLIFVVPSINASSAHTQAQKTPVASLAATPTSTPTPKSTIVIIKPKPTPRPTVAVPSPTPVPPTQVPATSSTASAQSNPAAPAPGERLVTFVNKTQQMIWVAASSNPGHTLATTGWLLPAGGTASTLIPDAWNGRIWGRTGCTFDATGNGHCETGDCAGHFQCGMNWGALPATLAEFNFNSYAGLDFYDVSLVDGSNLPMWINNYGGTTPDTINANGCSAAGCTHDVNATCPAILQIKNANGQLIACTSACNAIGGNQYCCRGPEACDPTKWPVDYAKIFKTAEPFAYSYSSDDATSTLTCKPECNYRIIFGVSS